MKKPKITLMIHTASQDGYLAEHGIPSYFAALTENLGRQTFKDFELVYVDTYYEDNKEAFANAPVVVKHVPIHSQHRYWYDLGHTYISAAKNTGILYADGELLITCDDSEFFPEQFLQLYWNYYEEGLLMHALHKRMRSIEVANGFPKFPIRGDVYINDNRYDKAPRTHQHGTWTYAGTSFSLKDALLLNGFNERMDGCKSLEDCDFGTRLALAGKSFKIDPEGYCFILDHKSYADNANCGWDVENTETPTARPGKIITNFIAIENYGVLVAAKELMDIRANTGTMTKKHLEIIQKETKKYRKFDPLDEEHKNDLEKWLGTPTFDLRKQREELRKSTDWKW
jgi:hypothetical protein